MSEEEAIKNLKQLCFAYKNYEQNDLCIYDIEAIETLLNLIEKQEKETKGIITCKQCRKEFQRTKKSQIYCSNKCAKKHWKENRSDERKKTDNEKARLHMRLKRFKGE